MTYFTFLINGGVLTTAAAGAHFLLCTPFQFINKDLNPMLVFWFASFESFAHLQVSDLILLQPILHHGLLPDCAHLNPASANPADINTTKVDEQANLRNEAEIKAAKLETQIAQIELTKTELDNRLKESLESEARERESAERTRAELNESDETN